MKKRKQRGRILHGLAFDKFYKIIKSMDERINCEAYLKRYPSYRGKIIEENPFASEVYDIVDKSAKVEEFTRRFVLWKNVMIQAIIDSPFDSLKEIKANKYSVDRINNDLGYLLTNVKFSSNLEQQNNRSDFNISLDKRISLKYHREVLGWSLYRCKKEILGWKCSGLDKKQYNQITKDL